MMPQPIKAPATVHVWLAEAIVALTIVSCLLFSVLLQDNGSSHISWADFVFAYLSALGLIILGFAYRLTKRSERLAATLVTAGLYVAFTNAGA